MTTEKKSWSRPGLADARLRAGLTVEKLAEKANLSATHYGQVERRKRPAGPGTTTAICRVLKMTFDDLFTIKVRKGE